ncbi:MAG: type III pantothenate kinase [Methylophilaceae bacterium]|jgi:pantothenate kinase type III|nr:type III pantothenate kinase [Methylophilaceae bacterium]NDF81502.1 type III pantothenate kinase [Methylophilaceae bacterium]
MFLLIDIGNTKTKWMLRDQKKIYQEDSFLTEDIDQDYFQFSEKIHKILVSNVAGFEKEAILKIKLKKFSCPVEFVKPHKKWKHLLNGYQDISSLGVDRWLSALSVCESIQKASLIVSVGTAVTIDYLSFDKKEHQYTFEGGVILPGLHLTKNTLSQNTAQLINDDGKFQIPAINTANAIQSGFILSVLGNLKSFVELALSKSSDVHIILSGGDAEFIYQHLTEDLKRYTTIKKDLVLDGLFVLANNLKTL